MKTISIWITLILALSVIPCGAQNVNKKSVPAAKTAASAISAEKSRGILFPSNFTLPDLYCC